MKQTYDSRRKGKIGLESQIKGKEEEIEKEQKYFTKNIIITPYDKGYDSIKKGEEQLLKKNIIFEPSSSSIKQEKTKYESKTFHRVGKDSNINIGTRRPSDYINSPSQKLERYSSTTDKNTSKDSESGKEVQYFTKNIVIQPVPIDFKGEPIQVYTFERESLNKSEKDKFGKNIIGKTTILSSREKPAWESRFGESTFLGIRGSEQTMFSEDMLKSGEINENTKLFNKQITITPVILPPLPFPK